MYRGCSVGVVVPAYNESGFVGDVIRSVPAYADRVYVVDDASTDDTWSEITAAAREVDERGTEAAGRDATDQKADTPDAGSAGEAEAAAPETPDGGRRVVAIRHEENRGVGGAIKTGYRRAQADGLDAVAVLAGDGQMDPAKLPRLLDPVVEGRADYAKGNRLVRPEWRAEMPRLRLVGNRLLTLLTKIASGYWRVGDPQNGYAVISGDALDEIDLDRMYEFYGYCNDLLVRLSVAEARVADVPIAPSYGDEQSHIELRSYVPRVSWMLLRTFVWRLAVSFRRNRHAAAVLYPLGAIAGLVGVRAAVRRVGRRLRSTVGRGGDEGGDGRDGGGGRGGANGRDIGDGPHPARAMVVGLVLLAAAAITDWASNLRHGFRVDRE